MQQVIDRRTAGNILLVLLLLALLFQLMVLSGMIPQEMVWGGRLETEEQGTTMAFVAIAVLVLMILVVLNRTGRFRSPLAIVGRIGMWVMFVLFSLNTLGNLAALDMRETLIFMPVTLLAALLCLRLAVKERE